jgi:hypothetical protein
VILAMHGKKPENTYLFVPFIEVLSYLGENSPNTSVNPSAVVYPQRSRTGSG